MVRMSRYGDLLRCVTYLLCVTTWSIESIGIALRKSKNLKGLAGKNESLIEHVLSQTILSFKKKDHITGSLQKLVG